MVYQENTNCMLNILKYNIGVLGCGFSCENELDERLYPWFDLSKALDLKFSFISARFREYEELDIYQDNTLMADKLKQYYDNGNIQYLRIPEESLNEAEARNLALKPLLENGCDLIWLLDLEDEYYTKKDIINIIDFVRKEDNQYIAWMGINFKNYVGDDKHWVDGFCPPRLFRTNFGNSRLDSFIYDNDVVYKNKDFPSNVINYKHLPTKNVAKSWAFIKHLTWQSNEKSKNKILYHEKHFGPPLGFGCSYKWDDDKNCLTFNQEYYKLLKIPTPEIFKDE